MVQHKHQPGFALEIPVAVAGFDRLKRCRDFQQLIRRITLFRRFFVAVKTKQLLCGDHLCLQFVCYRMGKYGGQCKVVLAKTTQHHASLLRN